VKKFIYIFLFSLSSLSAESGGFYLTVEKGENLETLLNKVKAEREEFEKFPPKFFAAYLQYHNPKINFTKPLKTGDIIFIHHPTKARMVEVREFYRNDKLEIKDKDKLSSKAFESRFYRRFQLMPITAYSRVDSFEVADNSQATIVSKQNYGIHLNYFQSLSSIWLGYLEAEFVQRRYETSFDGKSISEADTKNYWIGASIKFSYLHGFNSSLGLYLAHTPFFYAEDNTLLKYTYGDMVKVRISTEYELIKELMWNLRIYGFYAYLGGKDLTELKVDPGSALGLELKSEWKTGLGVIASELFFEKTNQNTSLATQAVTEIGARLGFQWDLI
jgi:hypothetical protein